MAPDRIPGQSVADGVRHYICIKERKDFGLNDWSLELQYMT